MKRAFALLLAVLSISISANAQVIFHQPRAISAVPAFQLWEQSEDSLSETLSQFSLPMSVFYPLGRAGELNVSGTFAHSRYVGPQQSTKLGALADLRADYVNDLWRDRAAVMLGISLPVGTTKLSAREYFITEQIASPLLPFKVKHYGEGLGVSGGLAVTTGEAWLYGAAVRGTYRGKYTPLENGPEYQPGSSIDLIAEATSEEQRLVLAITGTMYTNDKLADSSVFRDGPQIELAAQWRPQSGVTTHEVSARGILRAKDKRRDSSGTLATETENSNGVDFRLGYGLSRPAFGEWLGSAGVTYKHLGANGYAIDSLRFRGSGDLVSFSLGLARQWAKGMLDMGAGVFVGSAEEGRRLGLAQPDERIAIKGIELRMGYTRAW
jgi:hypothetical protein